MAEPTLSSIDRSGAMIRASCTASAASVSRSTGRRSSGRCWSSRASSSMSSTSTPIRADSCSTRCMIRSRSAPLSWPVPLSAAVRGHGGWAAGQVGWPGPPRPCGGRPRPGRPGQFVPHPAALPVVLGVAAHRGERGAQLVAGVRDELAHPLLGPPGRRLGPGPGLERRLDLGQHRVQRPAEPPHLGPRVQVGHPAGQVAGRDGPRGLLDVGQRAQAGPDDRDADDGQRDHDDAR